VETKRTLEQQFKGSGKVYLAKMNYLLLERIESRIIKLEENGLDMGEARVALEEAQSDIRATTALIAVTKEEMGKKLFLPTWLEPNREQIEKRLPPISV
jgi:hypothetical protein